MTQEEKKTYIFGINSAYHESSACLLENGRIIACAEEERFNRKKHGKKALTSNPDELPVKAMEFCLRYGRITWNDIDHIGFSLDPEERFRRNTAHVHPYRIATMDFGSREGEELYFHKLKQVPGKLSAIAGRDIRSIFRFIPHHICHAGSAFYMSPFDKANILAVDGIGEFASTWLGFGKGNQLERIKEVDYPSSLGFLWEKFSKYFGFSEYDACKVMGLATSAEMYLPKYIVETFEEIVKILPDGGFEIDDTIMKFRNEDYSELAKRFFKERRDKAIDPTATIQEMMIARALQKRTEEVILHMVDYLVSKTKCLNLCMAGGVALNSVANAKIQKKYPKMNIFIQPAAHDAGTAVGAAYYLWNMVLGNPKVDEQILVAPYYGPQFTREQILAVIEDYRLKHREYENFDELTEKTATLLKDGKIIGWFQGRLEIGPRALGNRSLIANPTDGRIKEKINAMGIKNREEFRPFAPSILEEHAGEWVDCLYPSPYMLMIFDVRPEKLGLIDAVTHTDRTSRIQSVSERQNPRYYKLIKKFYEITGLPLILNTSFNSQEPIVATPEDAVRTFLNTRFDVLVMGNFICER
ncbi:MAG: carbamoyltransferase C-terminal domain-containing protein [Candidatus Eremiobacteraeota bacterium]|nr:carbamoyltransferase C-terminal domain-containing protein [Candidatus Eremiobacteraeota bacterium]